MTRKTPREQLIKECNFANNEEELISLATEYRLIFPKGINRNTNTPNRQPVRQLCDAFIRMFEYFKTDCTKEEILNAAKKYVQDKQYDPYRRTSQYFIIKDCSKENKGIVSDLVNYIENIRDGDEESGSIVQSNWVDEL